MRPAWRFDPPSEMPGRDTVGPIANRRIVGLAAALAALAAASAYGGWAAGRSGIDQVAVLEGRVRALESTAASLTAERDRLKADRDRVEAQLAAVDATPAACPEATVSTLGASLWARFIVEYPCGWSVFEQPMQFPPEGSPRFGLGVDHLFFSPFPISLKPSERPPAEITLDAWYDEPTIEGDLPHIDDWLAEARSRFTTMTDRGLKTRSGILVSRFEGDINTSDQPRPAVLYVWVHTDTDGVRRIYEAFALEPSRSVKAAIEAVVLSFRVPGG